MELPFIIKRRKKKKTKKNIQEVDWEKEFNTLYILYEKLEKAFYEMEKLNNKLCKYLEDGNKRVP